MLTYASILEKPQRDARGFLQQPGEIAIAAAAALREVANLRFSAILKQSTLTETGTNGTTTATQD
jgi:hypothetical protein